MDETEDFLIYLQGANRTHPPLSLIEQPVEEIMKTGCRDYCQSFLRVLSGKRTIIITESIGIGSIERRSPDPEPFHLSEKGLRIETIHSLRQLQLVEIIQQLQIIF